MVICIAGKNNIAVECLKYAKESLGAEKIVALPVKGDDGKNHWNSSLIFHAKKESIQVVELEELYIIEDLILFSLQYDRIIDPEKFTNSKLYNIHFSSLPEYKGVYTTILPILHGKEYSGVTLHKIDRGIDTGEILDQVTIPISDATTSRDLYFRCTEFGIELFKKNFNQILIGEESSYKQSHHRTSYFGKNQIDLSDVNISCKQTAFQIKRSVNALCFREYQLPIYNGKKIGGTCILNQRSDEKPGTIINQNKERLVVSTIDFDIALYVDYYQEFIDSIIHGDLTAVKSYLPFIKDVNETNSQGRTPLMIACQYGDKNIIKLLISNGAGVSIRDSIGKTAVDYADKYIINSTIKETLNQTDKKSIKKSEVLVDNELVKKETLPKFSQTVPFLHLKDCNRRYEKDIQTAVGRIIQSGWYLFGEEKNAFEQEFSEYVGVKETIGVGSGLDALKIIFSAYRELDNWEAGDEIIVPANTFIASILAIFDTGLKPILVEPNDATFNIDSNLIEKKITSRTRAVMIVHLYGQNAFNKKVEDLCETYDLKLIEDAAQAHGAYHENKRIGSLGDVAAFSFYPGKNLGGMGDGGSICTDNFQLAECCRALSNYGGETKYKYKYKGFNSRLDEIQAAILRIKLKGLDADNRKRREVANFYLQNILNPEVQLPKYKDEASHVWHLFVVRVKNRNEFIRHLKEEGVEASIHYPIAPNEQKGYPELHRYNLPITVKIHNEVVSLPISPVMSLADLRTVVKAVNKYNLT